MYCKSLYHLQTYRVIIPSSAKYIELEPWKGGYVAKCDRSLILSTYVSWVLQVVPRYGPCGVEQLKPRMMRAIASLGQSDVQKILEEQGQ